MKMTIAKDDLMSALTTTGHALGKEAQWTKHYFFRNTENGVDVHTTNHRHCSSVPITTCKIDDGTDGDTFTIESSRIKKLLQFVNTNNALTFDINDTIVSAKTGRGSIRFACSGENFPYWDKALEDAEEMMTIKVDALSAVINHHKNFVAKPDAKSLLYRYITFQDGGVLSGNGFSMSLTLSDELKGGTFYLTSLDINPLLGFLKGCEGDITISKTEKMIFFKATNEALFGLVMPSKRAVAGLGSLDVTQMSSSLTETLANWSTPTENLKNSLGLLGSTMDDTDLCVKFAFQDGSLFLSGQSLAGDIDTVEVGLDNLDDDNDKLSKPMYFNRTVFTKVLGLLDEDTLSVDILKTLGNSPVVNHKVSGYTTYSLVVPLQTANF